MSTVDAAARGALIALLLLGSAVLLRERPALALTRIAVVFSISLCIQAIASLPAFEASVPRAWQAPLVGISVGNAVLFWIFVLVLVDDEFTWSRWHVVAWAVAFAVSTSTARAAGIGRPRRDAWRSPCSARCRYRSPR